ncbi:sulfatase [Clostridiales bacterium COT073_COT-073]|nr:sulfatase [Clostridiales bacterium COT073_COT-073]
MRAILILYDSLNKHFLPPYESNCATIAPNFERLAKHSLKFEQNYVCSMPCIPARRELHTGRPNFLHREWGPLEPFDDSMPEILKQNGIYTHLISDHLHYWEDGGANYHPRYSSWEIIRGQEGDHWKGQVSSPWIPPVVKVPTKQSGIGQSELWRYDWVNRQYIKDEKDFPQTQCFDLACEFIEKNKNSQNWFLQLETFDPHEPFYVPESYLEKYPENYSGKHFDWPRGVADETREEIDHCIRQYRALVSMCDHNLGRILDLMDDYNLWKDTLLIVGTDHGFLLSEHNYWGKNKMPYYNEIANTPLFIWDPRINQQNQSRYSLVQMIDWAPTLLSFFNISIPSDMIGKDLISVLAEDKPIREAAIYGTFSGHVNVTDGHYTYMRAALPHMIDKIYNYTLMPQHMTKRFEPGELESAELYPPFSFSKNCPVLKIKSEDKYQVNSFGNLLFDIRLDPKQLHPLNQPEVEQTMIQYLLEKMKECDCPPEQYERLGLS